MKCELRRIVKVEKQTFESTTKMSLSDEKKLPGGPVRKKRVRGEDRIRTLQRKKSFKWTNRGI
jgi:hypothetical protein